VERVLIVEEKSISKVFNSGDCPHRGFTGTRDRGTVVASGRNQKNKKKDCGRAMEKKRESAQPAMVGKRRKKKGTLNERHGSNTQ